MIQKHDLKTLSDAVSATWKNVNFANVNELDVRLRIVTDRAANFHAHTDSDELLCCLDGLAYLETDAGTTTLMPHELAVVPRNTLHRLRSRAEPSCSSLMRSRGESCRTTIPS